MIPFKATPELPPSNLIFNHFYQLNTKNIIKENHLSPDLSFFFFFLAVLGLHCCAWAFSSCGERGLLFIVVRGLLIAVASLVAEHRL